MLQDVCKRKRNERGGKRNIQDIYKIYIYIYICVCKLNMYMNVRIYTHT